MLILSSLFAGACSDDDDNHDFPGGTSAKLLPVKIEIDGTPDQYTFQYDKSNRLIKQEYTYKDENYYSSWHISYDSDGKIIEMIKKTSNADTDTYTFTYDGNTITAVNKFYIQLYEIDSEGKILKQIMQMKDTGEEAFQVEYKYDESGNISETMNKQGGRETTQITHTYDKNSGVFKSVNTPQWFFCTQLSLYKMFHNNVTSIQSTPIYDGLRLSDASLPSETTISYKYNANAYPIRYSVTSPPSWCGTPPVGDLTSHYTVRYQEAN